AARPAQPHVLEVGAAVDLMHLAVARDRRVVGDDVAACREADDGEQMSIRLAEEEPRQATVDRRDERYAHRDEALGLVQRTQTRDEALEAARARVRRVEGPVARAVGVPIEDGAPREVVLRGRIWGAVRR